MDVMTWKNLTEEMEFFQTFVREISVPCVTQYFLSQNAFWDAYLRTVDCENICYCSWKCSPVKIWDRKIEKVQKSTCRNHDFDDFVVACPSRTRFFRPAKNAPRDEMVPRDKNSRIFPTTRLGPNRKNRVLARRVSQNCGEFKALNGNF